MSIEQMTFPITGMTCANCVATIERNLKRLPGVQSAEVNLASERATVEFDPSVVGQDAIVGRIRRAGYDVAVGEAVLILHRLSDAGQAQRLEKRLRSLRGALEATVSLTTERASVKYIPTVITIAEIRGAAQAAGVELAEEAGTGEDAEAHARAGWRSSGRSGV